MIQKIKDFFIGLYNRIVKLNGSPQQIAIGFGVGVFLGILPATGPLAALAVAFIFRLNKAAALLGSVVTNTWLSLVTVVLAIKIGSAILGVNAEDIRHQAQELMVHFSWKALFDSSIVNILKPLMVGYLVTGVICGLISYGLVLLILKKRLSTFTCVFLFWTVYWGSYA